MPYVKKKVKDPYLLQYYVVATLWVIRHAQMFR